MTYYYKNVTGSIWRPIIEIIVKSKDYFAIYPVLIDSGADHCIFSTELAKDLGIRLSKSKISFQGISKDRVIGQWGTVEIRIANKSYSTKVIFGKISNFGHGIVGQQGFFDHFDVKLSYSKQIIEIEPIKIPN